MLKEMLWKTAAFLELCPSDLRDQVFLRIDEIKENYAVLREKVLGWAANKVEQEKSSGTAPMDTGQVDESQSALQSKLDWPGQWQVGEWDINAVGNYCYTCGAVATSRRIAPYERARTRTARVSTRVKTRAAGGTRATGTKERATTAARWGTSVPSAGSIGRTIRTRFAPWTSWRGRLSNRRSARRAGCCAPSRGFLVQVEEAGRSSFCASGTRTPCSSWPWLHGCMLQSFQGFGRGGGL